MVEMELNGASWRCLGHRPFVPSQRMLTPLYKPHTRQGSLAQKWELPYVQISTHFCPPIFF